MQRPPARLLASVAILAALSASGCSTTTGPASPDTTGSIATDTAPRTHVQWRLEMESWGERYRANPADPDAAVRYAQALRAIGQRAQAAAMLEQAAIHNGDNRVVLGAYGRALADNGSYQQALDALNRAHSQDQPDWRILSVQGAVLDQMGRHADAQRHYASALRLMRIVSLTGGGALALLSSLGRRERMTSTRSLGRIKPPAPVSGEISVETARMPDGRIAAMKPAAPLARISLASRIGSPALNGARVMAPPSSSMAFGLSFLVM